MTILVSERLGRRQPPGGNGVDICLLRETSDQDVRAILTDVERREPRAVGCVHEERAHGVDVPAGRVLEAHDQVAAGLQT
jgi:hypothetical protein